MMTHMLIVIILVLCSIAACSDILSFTIPNWLPVGIVALYPVYAVLSLSAETAGLGVVVGVVSCLAGITLFAAGVIGGGDAKLFAAVALWSGPRHFEVLIMATSLAGLVLAVLVLIRQRVRLALGTSANTTPALPYGVAIAAGAFAVAATL